MVHLSISITALLVVIPENRAEDFQFLPLKVETLFYFYAIRRYPRQLKLFNLHRLQRLWQKSQKLNLTSERLLAELNNCEFLQFWD